MTSPLQPTDLRALVAIDLGAESCRISLLRWSDGRARITLVHRFANGAVQDSSGHLRWPLDEILAGLHEGLRKAAALATEGIRSIAVDGWAVDYVHLTPDGTPLAAPFCYRDERTIASEAALHELIGPERMRDITGLEIQRINTAYQLFADSAAERAFHWLNLPEYILHTLGARPVSEWTNAAHTQMLALDHTWSREILAALSVPASAMPELVPPGTVVGRLIGPLTQLAAFRDTQLVAPCCHDTASAIAAIADASDDWAYISSGTWSLVGTQLGAPVNTAEAQRENFTNLCGVDGTTCFHKGMNGMWLLRNCLETWNTDAAHPIWEISALIRAAAEAPAPAHLLQVDDPELLLPGNMPQRINAQLKRRGLPQLSPAAEDAPALASLIFHSLAARYAEVLRDISAVTGKQFARLHIMGGGSQNMFLNRLTAQSTGLDVITAGTECSTTGNFAVQLAALEKTPGPRPSARWAGMLQSQ